MVAVIHVVGEPHVPLRRWRLPLCFLFFSSLDAALTFEVVLFVAVMASLAMSRAAVEAVFVKFSSAIRTWLFFR